MNGQDAALAYWKQHVLLLHLLQLLVIGDAGQAQAVNFFILPHQRIVGTVQHHRGPDNPAMAPIAAVPQRSPEVLAVAGAVMQGLRG
jgi:hypothetical protein